MASIIPKLGLLGSADALHLLRRSSFNQNKSRVQLFAAIDSTTAVDLLFSDNLPAITEPLAYDTAQPYIKSYLNPVPIATTMTYSEQLESIFGWWLREAEKCNGIRYKLIFFLHSVFVVQRENAGGNEFYFDYLKLLSEYYDGSLIEFSKKICRLNAMHYYLSNNLNVATSPNENYAREFLELFTITKGPQDGTGSYTNYTEYDVQQAARVLTGFASINISERLNYLDPACHIPLGKKNFANHDTGNKTFSAKFGNQTINGASSAALMDNELDAFVDMVFAQQATAKNYARRLYRFFTRKGIDTEIESDIITPIANDLLATSYNLKSAVKLLLKSQHFFDEDDTILADEIIGSKIKSPLDFQLNLLNQFSINSPNPITQTRACYQGFYYGFIWVNLLRTGFNLFEPLAVAGYPPVYQGPEYDRLWINATNLRGRYIYLIDQLVNGYTQTGVTTWFNVVNWVRNSGVFSNPANAELLVNELLELCFIEIPSGERYSFFKQSLLSNLSVINWQNEWNNFLTTNNSSNVKIPLERLIRAVVKSPEYQIC